jgi:hypothetical protein
MSDTEKGDRIAKFLARAGVASRRDAEKMLAEGALSSTTPSSPIPPPLLPRAT